MDTIIKEDVNPIVNAVHSPGHVRNIFEKFNPLFVAIRDVCIDQRRADLKALHKFLKARGKSMMSMSGIEITRYLNELRKTDSLMPQVSLLSKYIPKEGRAFAKNLYWYLLKPDGSLLKQAIIPYLVRPSLKMRNKDTHVTVEYPLHRSVPYGALQTYRQENTRLSAASGVVEQLMCADQFEEIDFGRVPSLCMKKNSKGFLNELRKKAPAEYEEDTGNRHPNHEGRVSCRQNLRSHFTDPSRLNVSQQLPHEIAYAASITTSTASRDLHIALWNKFCEDTREKLQASREKMAAEIESESGPTDAVTEKVKRALLSGNILGCADMSASMKWDSKAPHRPYDVAIGLTALMSEVAAPCWRDLALSFTDNPRIYDFKTSGGRSMNIIDRVEEIKMNVGYTTNYQSLHQRIIDTMKSCGRTEDQMPVIAVFTDGEFDQQISGDTTSTGHQKIEAMYSRAGFSTIPTIVYWNLKPGRNGVQASKDHPGVQFLQGQSPGLFKYILYGETAEMTEKIVKVDGVETKMKTSSITPYQTFRKAMDQNYYIPLLNVLTNSRERDLKEYVFIETVD